MVPIRNNKGNFFFAESVLAIIAFSIILAFNFFPTNHLLVLLFIFVAIPLLGLVLISSTWKILKELRDKL